MKFRLTTAFLPLLALFVSACATAETPPPAIAKAELATQIGEAPTENSPPAGQQWLYGSAESEVAATQTFRSLLDYAVTTAVKAKESGHDSIYSVIPKNGLIDGKAEFENCANRKLAAVFDADETLLWNVGVMRYMAEQGKEFDPAVWDKWEKTGAGKAVAVAGAAETLERLRYYGITIIVNTNRSAANAKGTEDTLRAAGLGDFRHGRTLFLRGDTPGGSDKDGRRALIAERYCVIAMAGDQLGDFSHAFNADGLSPKDRKALLSNPAVRGKWGEGWFLFPNPVYGPSIAGDFDEIFPEETTWSPKGAE